VIFGLPKLTGSPAAVQEFGLIGAGQWLRYLVGTAEVAGAIGLLTPWLAGPAAAGLAANMAGATIINTTVLRNTTYGGDIWIVTAVLCANVRAARLRSSAADQGLSAAIRGGTGR
jgi:uncharacterized membrane protein YphA (DoxX/SURF4 family)